MWLSDTSVKRPVFATVLNLLLIVFGVFSVVVMSVREYPNVDIPIVSVDTTYSGASAAIVESQITQILENQLAGIEGVRSITSSSQEGRSRITLEFNLSRDIDAGANDVRDRVSRVLGNLPDQANAPQIQKADADAQPIIWFVMTSDRLDNLQMTDYAERYIVDRLRSVDGVSDVRIGGNRRYAMRVWLDRQQIASRGLTVEDVEAALRTQNVERPAGRIESSDREFVLRTTRPFQAAADFENLIVHRSSDGYAVRLGDLARVELGAENPRGFFRANGIPSLGLGIVRTSTANTLDVATGVKAEVARMQAGLPEGMKIQMNYDSSEFIEGALTEVVKTLVIASLSVIGVIFLFLGSARATLIPAITVPISVIASFILLNLFGFSINILTLLALVLAIGLVVDDAIVMVENIHRRLELGEPPLLAAYRGAREVGFAIIATTTVLVAVFTPLAFLDGSVGRLFREFALALAAAVVCSSIVALTLAPVLASWLLKKEATKGRMLDALDRAFQWLSDLYRHSLGYFVRHAWLGGLVLLGFGLAAWFTFQGIRQEFAPFEDRGGFFVRVAGPEGASYPYMERVMTEVEAPILERLDGDIQRVLIRVPGFGGGDAVNSGVAIVTLKHWNDRDRGSDAVAQEVAQALNSVTDARSFVQQRSGFQSGFAQPVQVALGGSTYEELARWRDQVLERASEMPALSRLDSDYKETQPQIELRIALEKAGDLGIPVVQIAQALETYVGGRRVTTFEDAGEEYDIILQSPDNARESPQILDEIYVRAASGDLVPLSLLVERREVAAAATLNRLDRVRTITLTANLSPGYTLGEALDQIEAVIRAELPETAQIRYTGESREFRESSQAIFFIFLMALLIVYLVLAAQFESFIHPIAIMSTVPLAVFGALAALFVLDMSLNIYSQIGVVMLIGLAAKNGILIVEFTNQQRDQGKDFETALLDAASIRLRPILMTSLSTLAGAVPLILASGAGAEARTILGVVIFGGVAFATALTLLVVPCSYALLCRRTGSPGRRAATVRRQMQEIPGEVADTP